jgi:hypothetical protein
MSDRCFSLVGVFLCLVPLTALGNPIAYIAAGKQLATVDLSTGKSAGTVPLPTEQAGLAVGPDHALYGVNTSNSVGRIDTATGKVTAVGPPGFTVGIFGGDGAGNLYALDLNEKLYSVSPSTGKGTLIGASGLPFLPIPNYANSLAGDGSRLFYTLMINSAGIPSTLYTLDATTGKATSVGPIGVADVIGSGFVDGTLYGFTGTSQILTIDTATGKGTVLGRLGSNLGNAFGAVAVDAVPEPEVILVPVAWLLYRRRRLLILPPLAASAAVPHSGHLSGVARRS